MFPTDDIHSSVPDRELAIGQFWKSHGIYEKSLALRAGAKPFVFYEGPPTANGMPHPGHCLTRSIKDLFPRYRTMRGQRCVRKAGWDTHGLPVEVEVCKELGIHAKEEIEAFGVEPFIQKCQQSVWRYMREWEQLTERLGFWVDMQDAYVTYHQSYVESVWWSLKNLFDRGLLYQGHKIVWWWAQGGTALSAGEVGQGYREVADPSVFVRFPLLDDSGQATDTSLLVWTTTPWTLPSNQFVAVHPDLTYATVVVRSVGQGPEQPGDAEPQRTRRLIIAADLVETIANKVKCELVVESTCLGSALVGHRYRPPFDCFYRTQGNQMGTLVQAAGNGTSGNGTARQHKAWRVVAANYVTTDSGSGLVHQAPAFGEVDFELLQAEQARFVTGEEPALICPVAADGKFTDDVSEYAGQWVKDCDKPINRYLRGQGLLFHQEQVRHDYPFCWRAEQDPLIQYPRESWFVRTTQFKEQMLENNSHIHWLPKHIQEGRFGKFLASNVDWALSRERYWGTPLPIWVCEKTGKQEAIDSYDGLLAKPGIHGTQMWEAAKRANPDMPDDLRVHKPYIDALTYDSPFAPGARMRRVPEVIDCWYDSGAMPFAQWGYHGQQQGRVKEQFEDQFPADFISEALDQTRGWFYSQLAISTLLFSTAEEGENAECGMRNAECDGEEKIAQPPPLNAKLPYPHPFRNCIVLGLMLGEDGQKMSKSKRNYLAPREIFDRYGADALRWYFFANQPPWTSIRYSEQAIKESIPEFLLRLWNVTSFLTIYANIDQFFPARELPGEVGQLRADDLAAAPTYRPPAARSELDRWILGALASMIAEVVPRLDAYDSYGACERITQYVDALSNWYVRRSRERFWASDKQAPDKRDAYWTLYECLVTLAKVVAPFVPFLAETLWQKLAVSGFGGRVPESVHLCDYPEVAEERTAAANQLSTRMDLVRHISSLGRQARASQQLKVRQPLSRVEVILVDTSHQPWLEEHAGVIADELNVKQVEFSDEPDKFVEHEVLPNFKLLGPRLGRLMPGLKQVLGQQSGAQLLANLRDNGEVNLVVEGQEVALTREEIEVRLKPRPGWASANDQGVVVVLATELTEELIAEGAARDLVRAIQEVRKERDCNFTDRIEVGVVCDAPLLATAAGSHTEYIRRETLAQSIVLEPLPKCPARQTQVGDMEVEIYVRVLKA